MVYFILSVSEVGFYCVFLNKKYKRIGQYFYILNAMLTLYWNISTMIDSNKDLVTSLEQKVDRLVKRYKGLQNDVQGLKEENQKLINQLEVSSVNCTELKTKYENLKLAKALELADSDGHDAKLKINQMVREIDKCIALLNR